MGKQAATILFAKPGSGLQKAVIGVPVLLALSGVFYKSLDLLEAGEIREFLQRQVVEKNH